MMDGNIVPSACSKSLKMCTEHTNLQYKTIFTSFGQDTAEFYDINLILLTMIAILI